MANIIFPIKRKFISSHFILFNSLVILLYLIIRKMIKYSYYIINEQILRNILNLTIYQNYQIDNNNESSGY